MAPPITYRRGDERPYWQATVAVSGATDDLSTGHTFTCSVVLKETGATVLTKTTNIVGAAGSVVTVQWAAGDLDIAPGYYRVELVTRRTSDSAEWTVTEELIIKDRHLAEV